MAIYNWRDEYSVGIQEIDEQHKELVKMIDELYTAMVKQRGQEVLGDIMDRLAHYCDHHFAAEEALMQAHGYPYYQQHKEIHEKMSARVRALQHKVKAGGADLTMPTSIFLKEWLDKHILGTDRKCAAFLLGRGVQ
ncbi:MAG: bacteriohemerythrin [Desulfurivibrio sp.]|nr:bacteriohemerythrin [Desulfurivibrio sp.]